MGLIAVEGMHFYAHHGYYKEEQMLGGQYLVDVYVETGLQQAAQDDDLTKTVNYEKVYGIVKEMMGRKSRLIEHIAWLILRGLQAEFPSSGRIKVRVTKLHPPLKGRVDRVFVELTSDEI